MPDQSRLATLSDLFFTTIEQFPRDPLLSFEGSAGLVAYSTQQFAKSALALRQFLIDQGLEPGDRVAILAENRPEWHIADFGILLAGMVVVPIYVGLGAAQVRYLLEHSGCRAIVSSGGKQWQLLHSVLPGIPGIGSVISMEAGEGQDCGAVAMPGIIASAAEPDWPAVRQQACAISAEAIATIVYTSGTTGAPKGVMLTHGNLIFDLEAGLQRLRFRSASQALSVLPLAHVFERLLCYGYLRMGVPIAYGDPHALRDLLRRHRPAVLGCVPRILEKVQEAIESQVAAQPAWKQSLFRRFLRAGVACTRRTGNPVRAGWRDRLLHQLGKALVFRKVRAQLGGLRYVLCGGAWLNPAVEEFFRAMGFAVLQGYGLTETSPVIALNDLGLEKTGTVGPALDGVEVQVDETGEILARGPNVMRGYFGDPEATAVALRGGWFHTGDLGTIDDQGYLTITGRIKELIVLSTGKNVCPALAEQALERSRFIQNAFAVGHGQRFLSALIVPHQGHIEQHAREMGLGFGSFNDLLEKPEIVALFRNELAAHQAELAPFEQAKRFCFLREEALTDPELVTPTQKVRRSALERRYVDWIGKMYTHDGAPAVIHESRELAGARGTTKTS